MIISIWRYSHLVLAISSSLLLIVASVTGIFLAFEPVIEKTANYGGPGFDSTRLSTAVPLLKEKFPGIQEITVDDNKFVTIKYAEGEGDKLAYVDAATGEILGKPREKYPVFQWMTNMHRSLFLKETGRILIGITAFLLVLIAVSGILLVVQRQNGWRKFFAPVEKTGFSQYYHVVFGRLCLFFILAIALTGAYLAVARFAPAPAKAATLVREEDLTDEAQKAINDFEIFQQTKLSALKKLQYPFSDFPEDYFTVQLKDRELCINQFDGRVLATVEYSSTYKLAELSLRWHTGRSGMIWALLLAISTGYILFFIYSGFSITLQRRRARVRNKYKAEEARIVILVGSENGSSFKFADAVYAQLIKHGEKAYVTDMDRYRAFPAAEHLIIMASTYGQGNPPSNAKKFADKLISIQQGHPLQYSIVGFGSRSYQHYCKFAYDVEALLREQNWARALIPVFTVNDKSPNEFSDWFSAWTQSLGIHMLLPRHLLEVQPQQLVSFTVKEKTPVNTEAAFTIRLSTPAINDIASGDLLAIYPKNDHRERLYSIGKIGKQVQLSVRLHEHGLGSTFLKGLTIGESFKARIVKNQHFRFPARAKQIIMISNGTGIAPFLGMIDENRRKVDIELYCGFRNRSSFDLYKPYLEDSLSAGKLRSLHLCLSREEEKEYVCHRLRKNGAAITAALQSKSVLMICGSLSMQKDVFAVLSELCASASLSLDQLEEEGYILTDCY